MNADFWFLIAAGALFVYWLGHLVERRWWRRRVCKNCFSSECYRDHGWDRGKPMEFPTDSYMSRKQRGD